MTKQILLSLLNCSWQWGLLGGLTWLITRRSHRSNSTVHLLWLLFLLSLPILFALNQFVPALSIGGTVPELTQAQPVHISGLATQDLGLPEVLSTESATQSQSHLVTGSTSILNWATIDLILCIWAIGTFTMLIRLTFGLCRIHQLRRSAVVADDSYQAICQRLARQLNINRPVTVCFSDRVVSPISFGWLSPSILIPRKLNWEQFELVAAHELAHVQRLDWLINLFSHFVGTIFFFHPIYHILNRKLVHLRERICDDWVIQLTGARKNYAQCLLDLVRHEDRIIPLALSLNQPSRLESRIDSILKRNRRLDLKPKPRLFMLATFLLLTCLPLLSMAQLVPLRTFQVSLFAQTPQKPKEMVDETKNKQKEQKAKDGKMDGKQYKDESHIEVKDPTLFAESEENKIFSGPQPGEKLPSLDVTGISGEIDGKTFDIIAKADGKPLVLFLQDTNAVGIKGLVGVSKLLLKIDTFQKEYSKATDAEKSNQGLQIGVVFLADDLDTLPEWAHDMLKKEIPNEVLKGISPDGREGPGSYGLNRNVAQTVLIAKDGKVLHNFAFTQPMLYADPHFLGAIADAVGADAPALEKWLNKATTKRSDEKKVKAVVVKEIDDASGDAHDWLELRNLTDKELNLKGWTLELATTELDTKGKSIRFTNDVKIPAGKVKSVVIKEIDDTSGDAHDWLELRNLTDSELNLKGWTLELATTELDTEGRLIRFNRDVKISADGVLLVPYSESLEKLGITWEEGEQLLKETKDDAQMMDRKRQYENRRQVEVKDPTGFNTSEENKIFSGPQPGEKLPSLKATGIRGGAKDVTFDFIAKADGRPHVLLLQDESGVGLRGLYDVAGVVNKISKKSEKDLHISVVFLSDDPAALKQITQHVPENVLVGISPEGREGPGNYGLNRNVAQTIIIAKDGKVLHNFAFTQPLLYADPYLLGAIAQTIGEDPSTVEKWLNEAPAEDKPMQRDRGQMKQEDARESERGPSQEELVKRFDKDGDGELNEEEGLAARHALANRESQNRSRNTRVEVKNPAEFKKMQGATLFSGPQPGEKLPSLMTKGINGETKDKTYDVIAKVDRQLLVLFLQDESGLGLRGLVGISRLLAQIAEKSEQKMHIGVVFLGDTPDTLENQASKIVPHVPSNVLLGISPDGREGPGSYGLNRSVAQTVIIAKDGKVLHNFAFTQPMLRPDPYVLGAIGEAIGQKPATLENWLNETPAEGEQMQPGREQMRRGDDSDEARALGRRLREMVEKGEITGEEARERYEKAFPSNRESVDKK